MGPKRAIAIGWETKLLNVEDDLVIISAQMMERSPSEIDAALRTVAEYCVSNKRGTGFSGELQQQLLDTGNPSVMVSLAQYCSNIDVFNRLWARATHDHSPLDGVALRKGLRRACVRNKIILQINGSDAWANNKIDWLIGKCSQRQTIKDVDYPLDGISECFEIYWDLVYLVQNECITPKILSDAISGRRAFSALTQMDRLGLLRHISNNRMLKNEKSILIDDEGNIYEAVRGLLEDQIHHIEFRMAVCDILLSLSSRFMNGSGVPTKILRQWQFPEMEEILSNGSDSSNHRVSYADLMPIIAYATWPQNMDVGTTHKFFTYASDYVVKNLNLDQMLKCFHSDGQLFCILAIWNLHIMKSATKRAMLQQMIGGRIPRRGGSGGLLIVKDLREIYEKRVNVLNIEKNYWAFEWMPPTSNVKWRLRFRSILGLSTNREEAMLAVVSAIATDRKWRSMLDAFKISARSFGNSVFWGCFFVLALFTVAAFVQSVEWLLGASLGLSSPP
jgi:hypothetical protein